MRFPTNLRNTGFYFTFMVKEKRAGRKISRYKTVLGMKRYLPHKQWVGEYAEDHLAPHYRFGFGGGFGVPDSLGSGPIDWQVLIDGLPKVKWILADRDYGAGWFRDALEQKAIKPSISDCKSRSMPVRYDKRRHT
ncbi:hypothetical protein D6858_04090 [Tsuneonella suprasediminis]|uniref:Uncharacterized protein n=1 Tax=Tsuneonella suprasediminis TaxID=2306996 RepID=A0A419R3J0_9SPHN|nr:hypothetical protein [Tsuneonella suprasediminis]RJX69091.1 hypothetical protein D6858_04090 [Tsuneonella suprasediminis]